jgi:hypothetical protein
MTMRSEGEIRREVEGRLRRRGLLILDGGLWLVAGFAIYNYAQYGKFGIYGNIIVAFILVWTALVGLHTLAVLYIEVRERLVRQAIEREYQFYMMKNAYEKRKYDDSPSRNVDGSRRRIAEDGELIDLPVTYDDDVDEKAKYAQ